MSECAESSSNVSNWEENESVEDESLFEKPRGQRRWLGKEHHRGKERLHEAVKDRTFIKKTITSTVPVSVKTAGRIEESSKDGLKINVVYSMDKKNRWNDATTISLLGGAPENLRAEVVEKNVLEQVGVLHPNKATFAVHSRKQTEGDGEFEIRSATSSGKGQDYSNFLPKSREFSKKANARTMNVRGEEDPKDDELIVSYNIYKTHRSQDVVGNELFKAKTVSKSGRHRANQKIDMDVYEDDEEFDEEEDEFEDVNSQYQAKNTLDLTDYMVPSGKKQSRQNNRKDSELSYEMVDLYPEYAEQFNIQEYLNEEGFTFMESDITFSNQTECFEDQINRLREEKDLIIKDLRPNQFLIDISKRCQMTTTIGETNTVMVFTHLKGNTFNVIVNSTIISHPEKRTGEYLKKQISSAASILEAITRVAGEMFQNSNSIKMIKLSGKYYGEKDMTKLLNDAFSWDNQLKNMQKMPWPNQHYHATWANSEELSQVGGKMEWNDLCEMVKKENRLRTCYTFEDRCGNCNKKKKSHELFLVENESRVKCTDCLKNEFYREFIAKRQPIDLQTDTAEELEYLPTFIPLTLLNLYIRMVSETIYKDLGATGEFERCSSCKSSLFFEETEKCLRIVRVLVDILDYCEWEKKWLLRYSMMHAQGTGNGTLVQISCSCAQSIFNILLPTDQLISCPNCKTTVNTKTMYAVYRQSYWPFSPRYREIYRARYQENINKDSYPYQPWAEIRTEISKIPGIKASVMEVCGPARDVRFDLKSRNQMVKREQNLIRKGILEEESIENLLGTSVYLVENITAWMNIINYHNRMMKITLENMMETRKELMESMEGEDQKAIKKGMDKLRNEIDLVVSEVEKKIQEDVAH
uniref:RING-type domain-containing protein n=1 Tax=Caenorhabditis tropicalis TaxID=1561998 RepID=A0A1I7TYQ1_9PELO